MQTVTSSLTFRHAAVEHADPQTAVESLQNLIGLRDADAVILFVSADYDLKGLARSLKSVNAPVLCCTTAGEISSIRGYTAGGIAAAAIAGCDAKLITLRKISHNNQDLEELLPDAAQYVSEMNPDHSTIGLLVVDGLCHCEESLIERLQHAMPAVPIVGGSAADDCQFKQTLVLIDGEFRSEAASLLLLSGEFTAIPFQTHHFLSTGLRVVATKVNAAERRVIELDGVPANVRLSQLLDQPIELITAEWLATRPLMLKFGDTLFVRSVRTVDADGSLSLYCAIHEGEILHIGKAGEIVDTTGSYFEALRHQQSTPDLVLGFDCILRRLELNQRGRTPEMDRILRDLPFIGFSTFGEQYDGQHVNQTMTGVALWKK